MTLKETDNHSAQGIFESLMLDPDLEIGEGQTREEAAKNEAEYRARQHFNNMRALSLGTDESPVKSLLDFLSRPSAVWSKVIDIMKASLGSITDAYYYSTQVPEEMKLHPHASDTASLSEEGNKFIDFLKQNNMPAASVSYVTSLAKAWRGMSKESGEDEDGWIKHVSASIGTHDELSQQLNHPNNGQFNLKNQKALSKALNENGYHAHAPAPKASTVNHKFFEAKRYGSNTKDALEQTATVGTVNDALQKMGRKEKVQLGGSNKLKFDEETGNVQQWKAYKEAPVNDKRKHTRIVKGQIHAGSTDPTGEINSAQMEDYSVAEILRGLFHHVDMDGGQHDVTSGEAVQNNAKDEANEEKLEAYDEANKSVVAADEASGILEPITNDELDKLMHQFSAKAGSSAEAIDKSLPFNVQWWDKQHSPEADQMKGMAQEYGLVDGKGHFTPEHLQGLHDAIKAGAISTGHIMKGWPPKKDAAGNPIAGPPDKSGSPLHYSLVVHKAGQESGLHAYINHKGLKPVVPSKTANQIADSVPEDVEEEADEFNMLDVADMAEENNEAFPVENHVKDSVNHLQTMSSAVDGLMAEMGNAYMNSYHKQATEYQPGLKDLGESVSGLFDRFWSKGDPEFGAGASEDMSGKLQLNPHLISGLPGLVNNSKFVSHFDLGNSEQLSLSIQQHVKDIQGLHAIGAILNDPEYVKNLQKAGSFGAVVRNAVEQLDKVVNNPDVPILGNMHPAYITHSLGGEDGVFSSAIHSALGGEDMPSTLKGTLTWLTQDHPNKFAHDFAASLNTQHGNIFSTDELTDAVAKGYEGAVKAEFPDFAMQGEEPQLNISGPVHVEMMTHVDNFMNAGQDSAGTNNQFYAVDGLKETLKGELSSMATQPLGIKEKKQIFHNLHTALDKGLQENGHANEDFSNVDDHNLRSLHHIINNQFNDAMDDPMASGDWDAIKGYHAAKSLLDSKLAGKPINSMGALHLDGSAIEALKNLGGSMSYQLDENGEVDGNALFANVFSFMGDVLSGYSTEQKQQLKSEISMLHEHLEHSGYNPTGDIEDSPGHAYAKANSEALSDKVGSEHHDNIKYLAEVANGVGEYAATPPPHNLGYTDQHHQNALDAMHNGIKDAVDSGAMTQEQAQQLATDAGVDKKHFTGSGAVSTDLADTKKVNMEPEDLEEAHLSIEDASHNLNIAVASGDSSAIQEASDMMEDLKDAVEVHGIDEYDFKGLLESNLTHDALGVHEDWVPPALYDEDEDEEGMSWSDEVGGEEPDEDGFEDEGEEDTADYGDYSETKVEEPKTEEPKAEKPETEKPKLEDELDKVPSDMFMDDAASEKQKADIMQEIFNDDFKDSDDAKTYKAYLDKQKPEKIDALHETHVIGNLVKKNIKAKADKAKQKLQGRKDDKKAAEKEEADKAKAEEKQQKEDEKDKQKEADTVPHKAGEIEKKIKEGQSAKQMARDNMVHQHEHGDDMSAKAAKEHADAFHKFESMGVDMDELLDEKDEHGDEYGSEEHLQDAMKSDAKEEEIAENYKNHIESDDPEHAKNRESAFRAGEPGKFTTFDKKGNPQKDLHHTKDKFGEASLKEHDHGEGPNTEKFNTVTGEEHGTHTSHDKEYVEAEKTYNKHKAHYNELHKKAVQLSEDLEEQKKKLDEVDDDDTDAEGEKSEINDKISQIEKDKETNLNARVKADGERHKAKKALDDLPKPEEPAEDDTPKTGPPDPEVARRKMAEGYIWHEETRSWIMRENMKGIQGMHGAKDATMIHGSSAHGAAEGGAAKPFALNEDGNSPSDNHFVVSQAGVHKVGAPSAKPPGASSHQHTTGASLGHALKDTKVGANGAVHMPGALGEGGALASSGLATAGNHITQQPESKGMVGSAMDAMKGGAMDALKNLFKEEEEYESALDKLLVKYK